MRRADHPTLPLARVPFLGGTWACPVPLGGPWEGQRGAPAGGVLGSDLVMQACGAGSIQTDEVAFPTGSP